MSGNQASGWGVDLWRTATGISSGIEIEVKGCEVTLRGVVRHCADARRAQTHACAILGVKVVRDELQPKEPRSDAATEPLGGAAAKMGKPTMSVDRSRVRVSAI